MHWREGFRRVAKATAICYWLLFLIPLYASVQASFLSPEASPFGPELHTYVYSWKDVGEGKVRAPDRAAAQKIMDGRGSWDVVPAKGETINIESPWDGRLTFRKAAENVGTVFGWALAIYAGLALLFRGLAWIGSGFVTPERAD